MEAYCPDDDEYLDEVLWELLLAALDITTPHTPIKYLIVFSGGIQICIAYYQGTLTASDNTGADGFKRPIDLGGDKEPLAEFIEWLAPLVSGANVEVIRAIDSPELPRASEPSEFYEK